MGLRHSEQFVKIVNVGGRALLDLVGDTWRNPAIVQHNANPPPPPLGRSPKSPGREDLNPAKNDRDGGVLYKRPLVRTGDFVACFSRSDEGTFD